jgi:hypothetical protein
VTNLIFVLPILGICLPKTTNDKQDESLKAILAGIGGEKTIEIETIDLMSLGWITDLRQNPIVMNVLEAKIQCETTSKEMIKTSVKVIETMIVSAKGANRRVIISDKIGM